MASWPRFLSPVRSGTSTPCRGFRKSGVSSDLTGGTTKTYLCFWSLNHCQKELQLVLVHCPPAWSLTCSETEQDASLSWAVILMGAMWNSSKKRIFYCPRYLVPVCFLLEVSQRMSILGLLVSSLLCFVEQPYFCLVSGRQVQLHSHFGPALHYYFNVFWCALWELIVLPMPKMLFFTSTFPADS